MGNLSSPSLMYSSLWPGCVAGAHDAGLPRFFLPHPKDTLAVTPGVLDDMLTFLLAEFWSVKVENVESRAIYFDFDAPKLGK